MNHRWFRLHGFLFRWRTIVSEDLLALVLALIVFVVPLSAAPMRFDDRGLYMKNAEPSATTSYTVKFQYMTPAAVGSVDLLFCIDPIPYMPCVAPPGLDASNVTLSEQLGENGFSIASKSTNHIVLTRSPTSINPLNGISSYTFDNMKNPSDNGKSFSIRLKSLASTNGTGSQIDFGSVMGQVAKGVIIETQVPPMLIFCAAEQVEENCLSTNDNYFTDMGEMSPDSTLAAQSQMAIGTNASGGFAITAYGLPPTAGTNVMDSPVSPTENLPGTNQFGINLVENNTPAVGINPEGIWANALPTSNYGQSNKYMYVSGDVIATSPDVSLMKKFTVSYVLNTSKNMRAGVYTTTINYIASGRF